MLKLNLRGGFMMGKIETNLDKVSSKLMKFANAKSIIAIKDGIMLIMPLTLIGSIFLLLANIPLDGWAPLMTSIFGENWAVPLNQVSGATFDIMALVSVFGIAYNYAKKENCEPISAGILSIVSFLIIMPSTVTGKAGDSIGGVIIKNWTGGKGMIAAIIVGLFTGYVYSWFIKRNIRIKMPEGVPEGVSNAFSALIPGFVIITISMLAYALFQYFVGKTLIEVIYAVLQIPLQGLTDSLGAAIIIPFVISFLWWFGIHGAALIDGVMGPLLQANGLANQELVNKGIHLVAGQNAHIVTQQFLDQFIIFGGSGMTLGLVISMVLLAKSSHLKTLGKLSLVPGLFNINEPILFGFAIVLNPMMFIPFVLVPVLSGIITYFSLAIHLIPAFTAVQVPWTTPPIISGFIVGGWRAALLQAVLIVMAALVYLPFLKAQDKKSLEEEELAKVESK
jgi:cellobiose PTS system EIIC component